MSNHSELLARRITDEELLVIRSAYAETYPVRPLLNELDELLKDKERLDWLEAHPRLAEHLNDGKVTDCYLYGIAGAPGLPLREMIDITIKAVAKAEGA